MDNKIEDRVSDLERNKQSTSGVAFLAAVMLIMFFFVITVMKSKFDQIDSRLKQMEERTHNANVVDTR